MIRRSEALLQLHRLQSTLLIALVSLQVEQIAAHIEFVFTIAHALGIARREAGREEEHARALRRQFRKALAASQKQGDAIVGPGNDQGVLGALQTDGALATQTVAQKNRIEGREVRIVGLAMGVAVDLVDLVLQLLPQVAGVIMQALTDGGDIDVVRAVGHHAGDLALEDLASQQFVTHTHSLPSGKHPRKGTALTTAQYYPVANRLLLLSPDDFFIFRIPTRLQPCDLTAPRRHPSDERHSAGYQPYPDTRVPHSRPQPRRQSTPPPPGGGQPHA